MWKSGLGFEFNINISIFAKSSWMMFVKNIFISPQLTYKPLSWSFSIFTCTFSTLRCVHMKQCDIRFKKTSYLDCKQMKILIWSPRQIITGINQIIRVNMTFLKNIWTQTIILVNGAAVQCGEQRAVQCGVISIMIIMSLWWPDLAAGAAAAWAPTITDGNIKINDAHYNNF